MVSNDELNPKCVDSSVYLFAVVFCFFFLLFLERENSKCRPDVSIILTVTLPTWLRLIKNLVVKITTFFDGLSDLTGPSMFHCGLPLKDLKSHISLFWVDLPMAINKFFF